jgi:sec-independent protein translocase protein TatC
MLSWGLASQISGLTGCFAPLARLLHRPGFCIDKINIQLDQYRNGRAVYAPFNSSLLIGITLGSPYLLLEIWRFIIRPPYTKRNVKPLLALCFMPALFILGVLFGYYVITPESINFLSGFTVSDTIHNMFDIDSYLSSVSTLNPGNRHRI